jgi:hypothetical protein
MGTDTIFSFFYTTKAYTTIYTPPTDCFGNDDFTVTDSAGDGKISRYNFGKCFPTLVELPLFSPGICPSGFTTALTAVYGSDTVAKCCMT